MNSPKVHVYHPIEEASTSYDEMRAAGIGVTLSESDTGEPLPGEVIFDADAAAGIGVGVSQTGIWVSRASIERAPDLRLIANYTIGFDNVDLEAATEHGVLVVHSPAESNWAGVAEATMAMMLAMLKRVRERDRHVKAGGWRDEALEGTYLGARLSDGYAGLTVGIVGLGRIGSRLADLLAPWRVRILAHDPYVEDARFVLHNVQPVDLTTLLQESDVVSLHCNLTAETTNMIGRDELTLMKGEALLINTARGPIVDTDALVEALAADRIGGAALDALAEEPPEPTSPLLKLGDKVLLSPHMAPRNRGTGFGQAVEMVTEAVFAALKGEVPRHVVNPDAIPKWRARFAGRSLL